METKTFSDKVIGVLRDYCDNQHGGNIKAASRALGLDADKGILYKWLNGRNSPRLDIIGPVLDRIGVELTAPWNKDFLTPPVPIPDPNAEALIRDYKEQIEIHTIEEAKWRMATNQAKGEVAALRRIIEILLDRLQQGHSAAASEPEKKVAFMGPNSFQN